MKDTINGLAREEFRADDRLTVDETMDPEPGYPVVAETPDGKRFVGYYQPDEAGDGFSVIPARGLSGWKPQMPVFSQGGVTIRGVVTQLMREVRSTDSAKTDSASSAPYRVRRDRPEAVDSGSER